jgi:hypothetical protein
MACYKDSFTFTFTISFIQFIHGQFNNAYSTIKVKLGVKVIMIYEGGEVWEEHTTYIYKGGLKSMKVNFSILPGQHNHQI